jgi:quinol monooxygenase YgiN
VLDIPDVCVPGLTLLSTLSKDNRMYAMNGKLIAQAGKRAELVDILKRAADAAARLRGCRLYIVHEDVANESYVWIYEMWDDKESHDASLKDERVRALISEAMPLMGGAPEGSELRVMGGYGVDG